MSVASALNELDLLSGKTIEFWKSFDGLILSPRLTVGSDGKTATVAIDNGTISSTGRAVEKSTDHLLEDVKVITTYLEQNLPSIIAVPLSKIMMPSLISKLISGPLAASVPIDLDSIGSYKTTLDRVSSFAESLDAKGWQGQSELHEWTRNAPKVWLTRRSQSSLNSVRQILKRGLGHARAVERVETQVFKRDDGMFAANEKDEDWKAGWSENGEDGIPGMEISASTPHVPVQVEETDDDTSAWGFEEEDLDTANKPTTEPAAQVDNVETDAWGWEDDNEKAESSVQNRPLSPTKLRQPKTNGQNNKPSNEREITLKEAYYVTALPEQLLEIIVQTIEDAESLLTSR